MESHLTGNEKPDQEGTGNALISSTNHHPLHTTFQSELYLYFLGSSNTEQAMVLSELINIGHLLWTCYWSSSFTDSISSCCNSMTCIPYDLSAAWPGPALGIVWSTPHISLSMTWYSSNENSCLTFMLSINSYIRVDSAYVRNTHSLRSAHTVGVLKKRV